MKKVIKKLQQELQFHLTMKQAEMDRKKRISKGFKTEETHTYELDYICQLKKAISILEGDFLNVLKENREAAKRLTEIDRMRPAQELLEETYDDLISIYKANYL